MSKCLGGTIGCKITEPFSCTLSYPVGGQSDTESIFILLVIVQDRVYATCIDYQVSEL